MRAPRRRPETAGQRADHAEAPRPSKSRPQRSRSQSQGGLHVVLVVIIAVVAAVLGGVVDRFVLGTGSGGSLGGKLTISEGELSQTVATYSYEGKKVQLTAREALEEQGQLDASANGDGSYDVPTAEDVLAVVRSRIIAQEAERLGIVASEQDVLGYAESTLGTRNLADVAVGYGMSEEAVYSQLEHATLMQRLRAQVISEARPDAPALPPEPEEGEEVVALPKFASYIMEVAGADWDGAAGAWADSEGAFATALSDYEISADAATYDAALQAYWVAYQRYAERDAQVAALWTDYVNGLLSKANVAISTLAI